MRGEGKSGRVGEGRGGAVSRDVREMRMEARKGKRDGLIQY